MKTGLDPAIRGDLIEGPIWADIFNTLKPYFVVRGVIDLLVPLNAGPGVNPASQANSLFS